MNALISQRHSLRGIENDIVSSDPRLALLLLNFTLDNHGEQLPAAEPVPSAPARAPAWLRSLAHLRPRSAADRSDIGRLGFHSTVLLSLLAVIGVVGAMAAVAAGQRAPGSCPLPTANRAAQGSHAQCMGHSSWPAGKSAPGHSPGSGTAYAPAAHA